MGRGDSPCRESTSSAQGLAWGYSHPVARVDPEAAAQEEPWGPVRLKNGVAVSIFGWSAQWLFLAGVGGIVVETSLIEGGSGTWPHDDTPWSRWDSYAWRWL